MPVPLLAYFSHTTSLSTLQCMFFLFPVGERTAGWFLPEYGDFWTKAARCTPPFINHLVFHCSAQEKQLEQIRDASFPLPTPIGVAVWCCE